MPQLLQIFSTLIYLPWGCWDPRLGAEKNLPPLVTKWTSNPQGFQGKNCMQKFYANHLPEEKGLSWSKITDFYPNLATIHNVGVDGEVRIDQAHLVFKLLGHALSGSGSHRGWNWIFWSQFQVLRPQESWKQNWYKTSFLTSVGHKENISAGTHRICGLFAISNSNLVHFIMFSPKKTNGIPWNHLTGMSSHFLSILVSPRTSWQCGCKPRVKLHSTTMLDSWSGTEYDITSHVSPGASEYLTSWLLQSNFALNLCDCMCLPIQAVFFVPGSVQHGALLALGEVHPSNHLAWDCIHLNLGYPNFFAMVSKAEKINNLQKSSKIPCSQRLWSHLFGTPFTWLNHLRPPSYHLQTRRAQWAGAWNHVSSCHACRWPEVTQLVQEWLMARTFHQARTIFLKWKSSSFPITAASSLTTSTSIIVLIISIITTKNKTTTIMATIDKNVNINNSQIFLARPLFFPHPPQQSWTSLWSCSLGWWEVITKIIIFWMTNHSDRVVSLEIAQI